MTRRKLELLASLDTVRVRMGEYAVLCAQMSQQHRDLASHVAGAAQAAQAAANVSQFEVVTATWIAALDRLFDQLEAEIQTW